MAGSGGFALVLGAAVLLPAGTAWAALPSECTQAGQDVTCTFLDTAGPITLDVPDGVTEVEITARGGSGGSGQNSNLFAPDPMVTPGAPGGTASATLPVNADDDLEIRVGAAGQDGADGGAGGTGGGAGGSGAALNGFLLTLLGGGGGGGSEVRVAGTDPTSDDPLLAAGGGGGTGGGFLGDPAGGAGGGTAGVALRPAAQAATVRGRRGRRVAPFLAGEAGERGSGGAALSTPVFGGGGGEGAAATSAAAAPAPTCRT